MVSDQVILKPACSATMKTEVRNKILVGLGSIIYGRLGRRRSSLKNKRTSTEVRNDKKSCQFGYNNI